MKTINKKWQPLLLLLYFVLFTTGSGTSSMACQLNEPTVNSGNNEELVIKNQNQVSLPLINPLQMLTSKFM